MSIDTEVDGDPTSIRAVGAWLRDTLASQLASSADDLAKVKVLADSAWEGEAGDAFSTKMQNTVTKTDEFVAKVRGYATEFDNLANQVQQAQSDMETIRKNASTAGLSVKENVIEKPGEGNADKIAAYNTAAQAAEEVRGKVSFWGSTWKNMQNDVKDKWFVVVGDMVNGAVGTLFTKHSSTLLANSAVLSSDALKTLIEAKNAPAGTPRAVLYRDVDWSRQLFKNAGEALDDAARAKASGAKIGLRVGGALAVVGVAYDIYNGKDPEQAIVSGVGGFAASVAAGAAIGSFIPVPVAGTAVGAVGGAVVGLFTSGAIDSMYTNGLSLSSAVDGGANALGGAGKAIGGGVSKAWNAIF
ncbi:WXG100 family type VII secretion target [Nocardia sp. NPDC127579]|uniref:WXG100 family type VII secretion target n=1 Tax=Nocardia sp. NPDC127579 TaxID=3345402 RepID=UPI003643B3E7